jgi:hypothetical protein
LIGGLTSLLLWIFLVIDPVAEYKFMFTAVLCLIPVAVLSLDRLVDKLGTRIYLPVFVGTLFLMAPMVHKMATDWPNIWSTTARPQIDVNDFSLRLDKQEAFTGLYNTIREETPIDAILVTAEAELNLPTVTRRTLYVQPENKAFAGVNVDNDHLLKDIRGYDGAIIAERRLILESLYNSTDDSQLSEALTKILNYQRPLVLLVNERQHTSLLNWLMNNGIGTSLYEENGIQLWLVEAKNPGLNT